MLLGSKTAQDTACLLEQLIDCLEAVVPGAVFAAGVGGEDDTVVLPMEHVDMVLRVKGLACSSVPRGSADRDRVAIIESLELQAQILSLIAGVLRAGWRLSAQSAGQEEIGNRKWHPELGFAPHVLWRCMACKDDSGKNEVKFDGPLTLCARILDVSQYCAQGSGGGDLGTLYKLLRNKICSALKLALLSSFDLGWEGGESKMLHDVEDAPKGHWVSSDAGNLSSKVVSALLIARVLTLDSTRSEDPTEIVRRTSEALQLLADRYWANGTFDTTKGLGPSSPLSRPEDVFGSENHGNNHKSREAAHLLCQAFDAVEALAKTSCLLTSAEDRACWESDWSEQLNRFARCVLFESVGVLCFALKYMAETPAGGMSVYNLAGVVLLGTADDAVYAVTKGWPSLIAYLEEWRVDPHNDPQHKRNARLEGLEFLLHECASIRPKGSIQPEQCEGIQLTTVLNILLAMEADAAAQQGVDEAFSFEALLKDAAAGRNSQQKSAL